MKRYTKINSIKIATVFACLLIIPVSSCKKMNDDLNQDQKKLPYGAYVPGSYLTGMMQSIVKACPQWWQQGRPPPSCALAVPSIQGRLWRRSVRHGPARRARRHQAA
ncbi:MAG TPA: hypothetical protein VLB84_18785, partial [Bacteroidia bacterium]|nr:hypothetical protein [Bacteroidia bacterium]